MTLSCFKYLVLLLLTGRQLSCIFAREEENDLTNHLDEVNRLNERLIHAKLDLWSRGEFSVDETVLFPQLIDPFDTEQSNRHFHLEHVVRSMEERVKFAPLRVGPVKSTRRGVGRQSSQLLGSEEECLDGDCRSNDKWIWGDKLWSMRGGGGSTDYETRLEARLQELGVQFGPAFSDAIERNKQEHAEDCKVSCEAFYCADTTAPGFWNDTSDTTFASYSFGATPPEDFAQEFGFPLDLIKVTEGQPLFPRDEARRVIQDAEAEGVHLNEYESGKYRLGGDWLVNLPKTRQWFQRTSRIDALSTVGTFVSGDCQLPGRASSAFREFAQVTIPLIPARTFMSTTGFLP